MSAVLEIRAETAKKLASLAETKGVTVDELLYACVPGLAGNGNGGDTTASQSERVRSFIEWAKVHPTGKPLLSDEAISRRSIYER
jgi:hypothetical protein